MDSRDEENNICPTKMLNSPAPGRFVGLTICRCKTTCGTTGAVVKEIDLCVVVFVNVKRAKTMRRNIQIVRRVKRITLMTNLSRTSQDAVYKIHSTGSDHTCFSFFKNNFSVTEVEDFKVPAFWYKNW